MTTLFIFPSAGKHAIMKELNNLLHRFFIGTMELIVYLFYQYIAVLVREETGK